MTISTTSRCKGLFVVRPLSAMQQPDRPSILLPVTSLASLLYVPVWAYFHPHADSRTIEAGVILWFPIALILWFFVVCGAMTNYNAYSHFAIAQKRLWLWVLASIAPLLLLMVGSVIGHFWT